MAGIFRVQLRENDGWEMFLHFIPLFTYCGFEFSIQFAAFTVQWKEMMGIRARSIRKRLGLGENIDLEAMGESSSLE